MTETTQPHPEPQVASSLPVVAYLCKYGEIYQQPDDVLETDIPLIRLTDAQAQLTALRTQLQEQALQYLSDNGQWIEETGRLRAERDVLKAALVVGIEAIMLLADDYAENKSSLDLAGTECWRSALYIERKAAQSDAARSSLRAALEARKT